MTTGTHDIQSLLAARFQTVPDFGVDRIVAILQADLQAHNQLMQDMLGSFVDMTSDRLRRYGTSVSGDLLEVDEYGRGPTQKVAPGATVGFPLRLYQFPLGWTRKFIQNATPADLATMQLNAQKSHARGIYREIKRALFNNVNYTWTDFLTDRVELPVKRLINADSMAVPDGPNGETFDGSTHTHYLARAGGALAAADVLAAINTIIEHGHGGAIKMAISRTDEATVRALTGFTAYPDPRLIITGDTTANRLDISRLDNRAIGILHAAEVWVKPWAIANYAVFWDEAAAEQPLALRTRNGGGPNLTIAAEIDAYPLHSQYMEDEFGIGVWNRSVASILYFGNTTWANPTIN